MATIEDVLKAQVDYLFRKEMSGTDTYEWDDSQIPDDLLNELGDRFACLTHSEHGWTAHQWIPNEVIDDSVIAKGDTAADALKKLLEMLAE